MSASYFFGILGLCSLGVEGGRDLQQTISFGNGISFGNFEFSPLVFPTNLPSPSFPDFNFPPFEFDFTPFEFDFTPFPGFPNIFSSPTPSPSPSPSPSPLPPPSPFIVNPFPDPSPLPQEVVEEFFSNKNKWESSNIMYYSFTIRRSCFCTPESVAPVDVTVCGDVATVPEFYEDINTVDKVFAFLEGEVTEPLASLSIQYDPTYGFPTDFFIDRDERIADEEIGYTITNFQLLTQATCSV